MSDQLERAWEQATENAEAERAGERRSELERAFNRAAGGDSNVNNDVMTDPAFSQFVDIQERLPAAFGSEQAELRQEMLSLRDELTTKYDLSPDRLSELAGRGLPDDIGEKGRAAGGSFSIDIDPGRVVRGGLMAGADLLEPLLQPQQMLFRDMITTNEQREEFMRQADAYRQGEREEPPEINPPVDIGVGEVDWGRVFGPGLQDNFVTFGDVLKSAGVPEDQSTTVSVFNPPGAQSLRARVTGEEPPEEYNPVVERELNTVRTLGLFGDILVDPLLAGPFIGGLGRAAKSAGMLKAGDDLIKAGQQVERGMSPMGARAAAKAVAPRVVEGTEARIGGFLNSILSQPGPRRAGQDFSIGEWIFPRGRVPGRATREGEQPPDIFSGGTGRPEELVTAERVNEARVDDVLEAVTERAANIREALGAERYSTWARSFGGAVSRRVRAFKRAESLPTELRDSVQTLAAEVVDNRGIMLSPESMEELGSFTLRRTPVTGDGTIFGRESAVAGTLGEELQSLQPFLSGTEAAQSASDLYDTNLERVRRAARKAGVDEDRAVSAFDYIVNQANQADVIAGFHMSQYEPIKGKFFEHVAAAGGNADDAGYLWGEAFRYALEGENLSRFAADVSEEGFEAVTAEARRADRLYREWLSGGSETAFPEELRKLIRRDPNATRVVLGRVFNQVGAQQLDIGAFFNSLRDGHLRRAYATGQTDRSYRALARQIESGGSFTNRIIDSTMYGSRIEGKVRPQVQDLIADYVETVSPTVATERGFLIRQENLVNHLLDNGVSPMEAQKAIRAIGEAATRTPAQTLIGEGYTETSLAGRELRDIFAGREGAAEQRAAAGRTGQSFTSERLEGMEIAPASRQERLQQIQDENPFISESEAGRRLQELETSEFAGHLDTDTMGVLGRLFDPELSIQETGRAMRSQYSKSRFLFDAEKYARQAGAIVDDKAAAPERWALLDSEGYGPLNGKYVHPWLKKEVDNVLKAADSGQNARAFNRMRSALTSSWLTSPVTVAANHAGGTLGAVLQGANPFSHLRRVADFYRQVSSKKGFRGVEHYDDMSDLFQTGLGQENLAANLQTKHLSGANLTREKIPDFLSNALSQIYTRVNRRPIPGLGKLVGLDAFQLSENAHKWARYKDVLEETGDKAKAYRASREVTFDYNSMPELLRVGNDTGLTPFVAFPYFMTGRVISAALNKPGVLGAADRVANSVWNAAIPNEDIQYALNRELEDWEKEARYVPIRERGDAQWSMFPLGQLLPTAPWQENPYMGNLQQFGIYSGVIDMGYAQMNQGEAAFGARYGQRVFEATAEGGEKSRQMGSFIYNNYAPAWLRNLAAPGTGGDEMTGLIPDVAKALKPMVGDGMDELHQRMVQVETGRLNKDWFEQASSYLVRQTRPVSINPMFSRVLRERSGRGFEQDEELRALSQQLTEVARDPNLSEGAKKERMQQLISRTVNIEVGQAQRMMDVLQGYQTYQNQR